MLDLMENDDFSICDIGPRYADLVRNHRKRNAESEPHKKANGEIQPIVPAASEPCKESLEVRAKAHLAASAIAFNLECFGDELARRMHYKEHAGMDAVYFYLVEKYRWLPSQVKSLHPGELWWLLREEKSGWVAPGLGRPTAPSKTKA
jgi:hypothetical protein